MTKIIKIHYPSANADRVGQITADIRAQVLKAVPNNQMSFSFASHKESGYIMVYPTPPALSIRVSNHESDGTEASDKVLIEAKNTTISNGEAEGGETVANAVVVEALQTLQRAGFDIKALLRQNNLL